MTQNPEVQKHLALADECHQHEEESFQRSDTDGFLSQWASGLSARKHRENARLAENDYMYGFTVLMFEGETVARKIYVFKNNFSYANEYRWKLPANLAEKLGRTWIPVGKNSRIQKKLGLTEGMEQAKAKAVIAGSGKGLSGHCWVEIVRDED